MKNEKQYKQWIEKMYGKYKGVLFIEKYNLTSRSVEKNENHYLASKFNYPYLDATIIYSQEAIEDWAKDKRDAERRLVHEFCHVVTDQFYSVVVSWPTKPQIEEARERLTDHVAQIVNKHFKLL